MFGGAGNDRLEGERFRAAADRITDFTRGTDRIDLSGFQRFDGTFAVVDVGFDFIGRAGSSGTGAEVRFQNGLLTATPTVTGLPTSCCG
jgi:Ca2+-binding RTX toxin-like protein